MGVPPRAGMAACVAVVSPLPALRGPSASGAGFSTVPAAALSVAACILCAASRAARKVLCAACIFCAASPRSRGGGGAGSLRREVVPIIWIPAGAAAVPTPAGLLSTAPRAGKLVCRTRAWLSRGLTSSGPSVPASPLFLPHSSFRHVHLPGPSTGLCLPQLQVHHRCLRPTTDRERISTWRAGARPACEN